MSRGKNDAASAFSFIASSSSNGGGGEITSTTNALESLSPFYKASPPTTPLPSSPQPPTQAAGGGLATQSKNELFEILRKLKGQLEVEKAENGRMRQELDQRSKLAEEMIRLDAERDELRGRLANEEARSGMLKTKLAASEAKAVHSSSNNSSNTLISDSKTELDSLKLKLHDSETLVQNQVEETERLRKRLLNSEQRIDALQQEAGISQASLSENSDLKEALTRVTKELEDSRRNEEATEEAARARVDELELQIAQLLSSSQQPPAKDESLHVDTMVQLRESFEKEITRLNQLIQEKSSQSESLESLLERERSQHAEVVLHFEERVRSIQVEHEDRLETQARQLTESFNSERAQLEMINAQAAQAWKQETDFEHSKALGLLEDLRVQSKMALDGSKEQHEKLLNLEISLKERDEELKRVTSENLVFVNELKTLRDSFALDDKKKEEEAIARETELSRVQADLTNQFNEVQTMKSEIERVTSENLVLVNELKTLRGSLASDDEKREEELNRVNSENIRLLEELRDLQSSLHHQKDNEEEETIAREADLVRLQTELMEQTNSHTKEVQSLKREIEILTESRKEIDEEIRFLREELENLRRGETTTRLETELNERAQNLDELLRAHRIENEKLESDLASKTQELQAVRSAYRVELDQMEQKSNNSEEIESLKNQINQLNLALEKERNEAFEELARERDASSKREQLAASSRSSFLKASSSTSEEELEALKSGTPTAWHLVPEDPELIAPSHLSLDSPVIQTVISAWTQDTKNAAYLNQWARHVLSGKDVTPKAGFDKGIELSKLSLPAREGLIKILVPMLRSRPDIGVDVFERERYEVWKDLRLRVTPKEF